MELHGRNLSVEMQGEDIRLLQSELQQLGYNLPSKETEEALFGEATYEAVRDFQRTRGLPVTGVVDEHTARVINAAVDARPPEQFVISGRVTHQDGNPLIGLIVRAFDRDLRDEQPLGEEAVTSKRGAYEITYTAGQFSRAEKRRADLLVRVYSPEGALLAESGIKFNAGKQETINLVVTPQVQPLSEYEQLLADVTPILQDVPLAELTGEDIAFVANESGIDEGRIQFLVKSAQLARETNLPTEAFYGWARQDLLLDLEALLDQDETALRQALETALEANVVSAALGESLDEIMRRLAELTIEHAFPGEPDAIVYEVTGQLLNQEADAPLAGYLVHAFDLDAGEEAKDLGFDITDARGLFSVAYTTPRQESADEETNALERRLRLHISDPQGEEIYQAEIRITPDQPEVVVEVRVPVPEVSERPSPALEELNETLRLELPPELSSFLEEHEIHTLDDIRRAGGIGHLEGLPVAADHRGVRALEAHANLSVLSSEVNVNHTLIGNGFDSLAAIAKTPQPLFVSANQEQLDSLQVTQLHDTANAQKKFLDNVITAYRANAANGLAHLEPEIDLSQASIDKCECKDCEAAVSPLAYLADLLDYTVNYLWLTPPNAAPAPISLDYLQQTFHQHFGDLPTACEEMDKKVRQVRICIEVLRRYLETTNQPAIGTTQATVLNQAEMDYRRETYQALLTKFGTSYEEIRLARTAGEGQRQALAARLGIEPEHLDKLFLEPSQLSEQDLEVRFGLVDTQIDRDPLSDGAKLGDQAGQQAQLKRWNLDGVEWNRNTDVEGLLYVRLNNPGANAFRVELYRDPGRTQLVASGQRSSALGTVVLRPENVSGLSGQVELAYVNDSNTITLSAVPSLLAWRLHHLRTLWQEQDWPSDRYMTVPRGSISAEDLLPIVDPDIIGPNDFRSPFPKVAGADPDRAFDIWLRRRQWVDAQIRTLLDTTKNKTDDQGNVVTDENGNPVQVPDLAAMFGYMYQPLEYPLNSGNHHPAAWSATTQPGDFDSLYKKLSQGSDVEETEKRVQVDLNLSVESFSRLIEIWQKDERAQKDNTNEAVKDEEWRDVYSILGQARKISLLPTWRQEEAAAGVRLGPGQFWLSLRNSQEGEWPPRPLPPNVPMIDPGELTLKDLPEPMVGERAIALWQARQARLDQIPGELETMRAAAEAQNDDGFDAILKHAFGDPLPHNLDDLQNELNTDTATAKAKIEEDLHLTEDQFTRLMAVRAKYKTASSKPTGQEWAEVYTILTRPRKIIHEYPGWAAEEANLQLTYWQALKARLPRWRASVEARQAWREALCIRSRPPLIDPDLLTGVNFPYTTAGRQAHQIWQARKTWVANRISQLQTVIAAHQADLLDGLDAILVERLFDTHTIAVTKGAIQSEHQTNDLDHALKLALGDSLPDLDDLHTRLTNNQEPETTRQIITESLYLPVSAFSQLMTVKNRAESNQPVTAQEWNAVYQILARAKLVANVISLVEARERGEEIASPLRQLGLTPAAFSNLVRMRRLVAQAQPGNDPLLESEWDEVLSILVQVQKRRQFALWRDEEQTNNLIHGPDYFQLPEPGPVQFPSQERPALPAWRASRLDYMDWADKLQSRIDQQQTTVGAFYETVSVVEEETLPMLRDALILASDAVGDSLDSKAKWVTDHLLIDARIDGCQQTTRVSQAIETIQTLLWSVQTGQLYDTYPTLTLFDTEFEERWRWIGSYTTWRAAMFVFLYPENILLPSLRKWQTPAFRQLVNNTRSNRRLAPEQACQEARKYSDYLRDVANLKLAASCHAVTRIHEGDCRGREEIEKRTLFYTFALGGETQTAYWSAYDAEEGASGYAQTFWQAIPTLKNAINIVGAQPYEISARERYIFLFVRVQEGGAQKLQFVKYDLENQRWVGELTPLDLPNEATSFTAVVKQSSRTTEPPHLAIRLENGAIYERRLNREGSEWEELYTTDGNLGSEDEWIPLVHRFRGRVFSELCAMVEIGPEEFCLIARTRDRSIQYRLFGPRDDGSWRVIGYSDFRGAFSWPGTSDIFVLQGEGFFTWYRGVKHAQTALKSITIYHPSGWQWTRYRIIHSLNQWLEEVVGLSLRRTVYTDTQSGSKLTYLGLLISSIKETVDHALTALSAEIERNDDWRFADAMFRKFTKGKRSIIDVLREGTKETETMFAVRGNDSMSSPKFIRTNYVANIAPTSGAEDMPAPIRKLIAFSRTGSLGGVYRLAFMRDGGVLKETPSTPLAPRVSNPLDIVERLPQKNLQQRHELIEQVMKRNSDGPRSNLTYLEEAYYFVPMHLALQLQRQGHYIAALDWFCTVYDHTVPEEDRKIYYGLKREEDLSASYERVPDWLLDPINPHLIAATRANTYTRFTLLSIVRCLLAYADAEFTRDTAESIARARVLYMTALELLETKELRAQRGTCDQAIARLAIHVKHELGMPDEWLPPWSDILQLLPQINDPHALEALDADVRTVLGANGSWQARLTQVRALVNETLAKQPPPPVLGQAISEHQTILDKAHAILLSTQTMHNATQNLGTDVKYHFDNAFADLSQATYVAGPSYSFCIAPNPVLQALRLRAELNL
ncbi:MAG: peptidoglycan-binding protein, partial [Acidobacteria bacterium]|nr:peptidoglycan-binding protein [Acidobacteriota bacterium]